MKLELHPSWSMQRYQKYAKKYQIKQSLELLRRLPISVSDCILDVGCGDGQLTAQIAERVPQGKVVGIDHAASMLAEANKWTRLDLPLSFVEMNAEDIQLHQRYNWIVSFYCLQWIENKQAFFNRIPQLLQPYGRLACVMTNRNPYLYQARYTLIQQPKWRSYFEDYHDITDAFDDDGYAGYAQSIGLADVQCVTRAHDFPCQDREQLEKYLQLVTPALVHVPLVLQDAFIRELTDCYLDHLPPKLSLLTYLVTTLTATYLP
jgi:SAM-dependent methyltransferase